MVMHPVYESPRRLALAFLGFLLAAMSLALLVRIGHPNLQASPVESTWAPIGLHAIASDRGALALLAALAALGCFVMAIRPGRRATPATFFDEEERREIQIAIAAAEDRTSGEIRVHLEPATPAETLAAARFIFESLGMSQTAARNGVLIYISVQDRRFAILGDEGIDRVVETGFWDEALAIMKTRFEEDRCARGVVEAVADRRREAPPLLPHGCRGSQRAPRRDFLRGTEARAVGGRPRPGSSGWAQRGLAKPDLAMGRDSADALGPPSALDSPRRDRRSPRRHSESVNKESPLEEDDYGDRIRRARGARDPFPFSGDPRSPRRVRGGVRLGHLTLLPRRPCGVDAARRTISSDSVRPRGLPCLRSAHEPGCAGPR